MLVIATVVLSCSSSDGGDDSPTPVTPPTTGGGGGTIDNPTYTANIKSIIDNNCVSCHNPMGENPNVLLQTYDQVKAKAAEIKIRIEKPAGDPLVMPKGGKLSQANIDLINKWIANGMPNTAN